VRSQISWTLLSSSGTIKGCAEAKSMAPSTNMQRELQRCTQMMNLYALRKQRRPRANSPSANAGRASLAPVYLCEGPVSDQCDITKVNPILLPPPVHSSSSLIFPLSLSVYHLAVVVLVFALYNCTYYTFTVPSTFHL